MLVACRLAGLSALGAHYAGVNRRAQCGADANSRAHASQRAGFGGAELAGPAQERPARAPTAPGNLANGRNQGLRRAAQNVP
jgi:hypothetical protein